MIQKLLLFTGRFIFRTTSIFILLCNLFVLCVYAYLRCSSYGKSYPALYSVELLYWQKILLILAICGLFITGVILYRPRKEKQTAIPSKIPLLRKFFTLLSVCFFLYLVIDGLPPKEVFTKEYLEPRDFSFSQPTNELNTLMYAKDEDVPNLKRLREDRNYEEIEIHTAEIEGAWRYIVAQRAAVDKLSGEFEFLDKVEADPLLIKPISGLKVGAIYQSYTLLRARQGDLQGAVEALTLFHDVACKGLEGSVGLLPKLVWTAAIGHNLRTALQLAYEYTMDEPLRKMLLSTFDPISDKEASFFKPWIGAYISSQKALEYPFVKSFEGTRSDPERYPVYHIAKLLPEQLVAFLFGLTRQKHRSAQLLYDVRIPVIYTAMSETYGQHVLKEKDFYPPITIRNVGGWYFYQPPHFFRYEERMKETQVQSELLYSFLQEEKVVIADRLQDISINGLRDAGDDGKLNTEDDIALKLYYPVARRR